MPPPFESLNGEQMWVSAPFEVTELSSETGPMPMPNFMAAGLTCDPVFLDWGPIGPLHVFDSAILPNASYNVQAIAETCYSAGTMSCSPALGADTSLYGDLVGECIAGSCTPPNGNRDFNEISAVVDKFLNRPTAPKKSQADVFPDLVDFKIDFGAIPAVVNGSLGLPYQSPTPDICPAE